MKRLILILCVTVFSSGAFAGSIESKVQRVNAATEQYANTLLDGVTLNISGHPCATNTTHVAWDKTTEHGKQMLSLALAGMLANKRLYIAYSDTQCGLHGNQVLVNRIDVLND